MYALLIVIHVIVSTVLILVILLQAGRGGGLSESFGISSTQTFFGTSAARFLQRVTSVCAIVFLLTCLSLAALSTRRSRSLMERQRIKEVLQDLVKEEEKKPAEPENIESVKTEPEKTPPLKKEAPKAE
ncbi:MAG: preprotein translocase subunit SecG [Candidatus Omnitrophica bacterium]|nr:preprotein translocase subunit SecG [Candidatus Omnitrophota bacterium]